MEVREAAAEVETTTGTVVQVFLLAEGISEEAWNSDEPGRAELPRGKG